MGTNTPNQDSDTSKQLPSSEDFEESSEQLKGMLELLEPLNFTEIKEINGLLDEMADKVKEYNSQDSKLSTEEIEDCSHFIAKNLTPEALETIKYTVILIIRSEDELYKHKIRLNYKIEIVFNSIVFVLSPMIEDPTYKLDFPSDNFTIIDVADQINTAVSEELGDEIEPRVIARASSGTLIGEGSRSLLSTYTSKTLKIASINPLEYLYVLYSNSKNSEKIVNDRYSLSKLAYSLVSSALDDYMGAVLASEGKLASRKSIIAHIRSASIKFSCELMELIQVMRLTILKEGTSEKYVSTGPAFYNSKRTTITDKTPSDTDRIDSILTVCMNLVDGFIVLAIMNEPQILDKISESVSSQHIESQDKKDRSNRQPNSTVCKHFIQPVTLRSLGR
jgi:Rad3-related DNA helicase